MAQPLEGVKTSRAATSERRARTGEHSARKECEYPGIPDAALVGGFGTALDQIFTRKFPTYGIGVQVTLPIRNRIAEADLARDEIQLKQSQIRVRQLQNQARLEVEDALIAMRRARASHEAAVQARVLQEESLAAERQF